MFIAMITLFLSLQTSRTASEKTDFGLDSLRNIFPQLGILKALKKKTKRFSLEFRNFNKLICLKLGVPLDLKMFAFPLREAKKR